MIQKGMFLITFNDSVFTLAFMGRPLYFQHDEHSRTIIGIQVKYQKNGTNQFNLLILDPSDVSTTHVIPFVVT